MTFAFAFALSLAQLEGPPPPPDAPDTAEAPSRAAAPQDAAGWARLGSERLAGGDPEGALEALGRALELDPTATDARYNYAFALRSLGRNGPAAAAYRTYLEQVPTDGDAWYALAQTEEANAQPLAAAQAYERYADLETRPQQAKWVAQARARATELRAEAGSAATGSGPATTAEASPDSAPTTTRAGPPLRLPPLSAVTDALARGEYAAALDRLRRDVPVPEDGWSFAAYGSAHLGLGEFSAAARAFAEAERRLDGEAQSGARLGRAEALRSMGKRGEARALYAAVLDAEGADSPWGALAAQRLER